MKPPLTKTQLRLIDHFSNRRFDCEFWSSPNVRQVIRQLLEQIKWMEKKEPVGQAFQPAIKRKK